jgi:EF hand
MKRLHLLATAALVLLISANAEAQDGPRGPKGPGPGGFGLLEFDTNADGRITRDEFDGALKTRFAEIDTNKDGTATREEAKAAMQARLAKMESGRFASLDTDNNGQLSLAEFTAAHNGPGGPGDRRGPGGPEGPVGPRGAKENRAGPGDADRDGKVTFVEFSKHPLQAFIRADANKDGTVTIAELQAQPPGSHR